MNIDLLRQQQRWRDGLQELRTGFASLESQAGFHYHIAGVECLTSNANQN